MIRKLLMVAAAAAVPMSGLVAAGVVGTGTAGAKTAPPVLGNITCGLSGSVNFGTNPGISGISLSGTVTTNKDSTTLASTSTSGCTGGNVTTGSNVSILTKNTKCAPPYTSPAGCAKKLLIGEAGTGLAGPTTTKAIEKALKSLTINATQGSNSFALKTKVSSVATYEDAPSGPCANEVGFGIGGSFKTSPKSSGDTSITLTICLGDDSGVTGPVPTADNFFADLTAGDTIGVADIDPTSSSLAIS